MKKIKPARFIQYVEIVLFASVLLFFMITTAPKVLHKAMDDYDSPEFAGFSAELPQLQTFFKENLILKNNLTDFASASDVAFSRIFTDNYHYLKDKNGMVFHLRNDIYEPEWIEDIVRIKQYVQEKSYDTKIVYVQNPLRIMTESDYKPYEFTNVDEYAKRAKDILDDGNVPILSVQGDNDTYFVTDMHATTDSQVDAMRQIAEYLEANEGIAFSYKELIDIHNADLYDDNSYRFVGGYCRSIGANYTKKDTFHLYLPKFDTNYAIDFVNTGVHVEGSFAETLTRIPETYDMYSYWITNMAYYGQSIYRIKNTLLDGEPRVLFVMDSAPMTGICYLSTICSEVCVYDPRFTGDNPDRDWLKEHIGEYDAVIFDTLENSMDYENIFD